VIPRFLAALNVPPQQIPADPAAQAGLYRTLLADRRVLVVLDNARDPDQVRPLLPGTAGCLALVTSRNPLTGLVAIDGAQPLRLDLLSPGEARDLLTARLGADRVAAEPDAVEELITACARLPLALAIAAARAGTQPDAPLAAFATELRAARGALDALTGDDAATDIRAVFECSYRALSAPAARLFRLLGLHPAADIPVPAAASLAGLPAAETAPLLAELTRAQLVTAATPGRYGFHDLLREYARELAHRADSTEERREAVRRYLDHYLHTSYPAGRLMHPTRDPITLAPPAPGVTPEPLADRAAALDWFDAEHDALLAAIDEAARTGWPVHAWQLTWGTYLHLDTRGRYHDVLIILPRAIAAAHEVGDLVAEARATRDLSRAYHHLGQGEEARRHLERALALFHRAGDKVQQAHTHVHIGAAEDGRGRYAAALDRCRQAYELFQAADHRPGQATALNAMGWSYARLGQYRQAVAHCERALALHEANGNLTGQATTLNSLGYAHRGLGDTAEAIGYYTRSADLYRQVGDRYYVAEGLTRLGEIHEAAGDPRAAADAWRQALDILTDLDHPDADEVRAKLDALSS
jgi:tetratricopeptide (TPR) repeat protein